jgi:adenosine deaminase
LPAVVHAGETDGATSIQGALHRLHAVRIGHGIRCLEDPALVAELRERQIPLEVCPSSNVCLKGVPSLVDHPLPRLFAEGLYLTVNSDDPPMFDTTLTQEYLRAATLFANDATVIEGFIRNAAQAALLPEATRQSLLERFASEFVRLRQEHLSD